MELIDRQDLMDRLTNRVAELAKQENTAFNVFACGIAFGEVVNSPVVPIQFVPQGTWQEVHFPRNAGGEAICSVCGLIRPLGNYCSNCGARNREVPERDL